MSYTDDYAKAVKYSAKLMAQSLTPDEKLGTVHADAEFDHTKRLAFADSLDDEGRNEEAEHVRDVTKPIHIHPDGRVEPAVKRYRSIGLFQGVDFDEAARRLYEYGHEVAIPQIKDYADTGSGLLSDKPGHSPTDEVYKHDGHILSVDHRYDHVGLEQEHWLPASAANHNHMDETGKTRYIKHYDINS